MILRLLLLVALLAPQTVVTRSGVVSVRTCVGSCIHVTKYSATEWRIITPVASAPQTYQAEWRFNTSITTPISASGPIWESLGLFGRDLATPAVADVEIMPTDSVPEYAWVVGTTGAAEIGFGFYGNGHGGETLSAPITFTLDGVDISTFSVGSKQDGMSLVIVQNKNFLLPKNPDGSENLSTQIGTGVTTHTFNVTGMKVTHTHTFSAGYEGYTAYAAMMPLLPASINRVNVNGGAAYTPLGNDTVQFTTTQIATTSAWHTTAHRFLLTMSTTGGTPCGSWAVAGPDYGFFVDLASLGKTYILFINDTYASRQPLSTLGTAGTITCEQQYAPSYRP